MPTEKPIIFLSYVQEDQDTINSLYQELLHFGFKPWIDKEDLRAGEDWKLRIRKTLRDSHFILVFLSQRSITKRAFFKEKLKWRWTFGKKCWKTIYTLFRYG